MGAFKLHTHLGAARQPAPLRDALFTAACPDPDVSLPLTQFLDETISRQLPLPPIRERQHFGWVDLETTITE